MNNLTNKDLIEINGGADGDFAKFHGYYTALACKAVLGSIWILNVLK